MNRLTLVTVGLVAVALVGAHAAANARRTSQPGTAKAARVLSLHYGRVRPDGAARAYYALTVRAVDPRGQIVSIRYRQVTPKGGPAGIADAGCGLGGHKNGDTTRTTIPVRKLKPADYTYEIEADGSVCNGSTAVHKARRVFRFRVG